MIRSSGWLVAHSLCLLVWKWAVQPILFSPKRASSNDRWYAVITHDLLQFLQFLTTELCNVSWRKRRTGRQIMPVLPPSLNVPKNLNRCTLQESVGLLFSWKVLVWVPPLRDGEPVRGQRTKVGPSPAQTLQNNLRVKTRGLFRSFLFFCWMSQDKTLVCFTAFSGAPLSYEES